MALWTVDSSFTTDSVVNTTDGFEGGGGLAGQAITADAAVGQLINFASVILTAPLYTGTGGIFDPGLTWPFSTPIVGSKIWYDPTILTVLPSGETVWTTNVGTAEIQFNDGVNLNEVDLFITPFLVGAAQDTTSASAFFVSAAQLVGAATDLTTVVGALTTGIQVASAASDLTSAIGALTTAIQMAAAATDAVSAQGVLVVTGATLVGAATDASTATAFLTAQIAMAGAASDVVTAAGALSTQILLAANATDAIIAAGALGSGLNLAGAATDTITAAGLLGSLQQLFGAANDVTAAAGALITQIVLSASAQTTTAATGTLSSQIKLSAAAADAVTASGNLGVLALNLRPSHLITVTYYSQSLLGTAGPLPYGEFFSRVGDLEIYAIDWTGWLANYWERGTLNAPGAAIRPTAPNGFQFITANGGQSGNAEPTWPTVVGQTVNDGSTVWTCEAIDNTTLFSQVQSAAWQPPSGVTVQGQEVSGQLTLAEINTAGAVAGPNSNYAINIAVTMTDGEVKVGQILLKVR